MGMMMSIPYSIDESSSIYDVRDINSSFAFGNIKVLYTGKNRNGSSFSKESVTRALPSLKNVPIVCNYDYEENEIGGHDIEVVQSKNGIAVRNLTTPIGVVPETAKFRFEVSSDENGIDHEYLVVDDVILWKRQDAYSHIVNDLDGKVAHSMEINVKDGNIDDKTGAYAINSFEFTALCLLERATPCFQGSELTVFSMDEFKEQFAQMTAELKECFATLVNTPDSQEFDINHSEQEEHQSWEEGGEKVLDEKLALVAEYGINVDDLDFAINDFSIEELKEKLDAMKEEFSGSDEEAAIEENGAEFAEETKDADSYELNCTLTDSIIEKVNDIEIAHRPWGDEPRYWLIDFDSEASKVYVIDSEDGKMYGFDYSMNGDSVDINIESKGRVKWAIVDYDEGEQILPFSEMFKKVESKIDEYIAACSELEQAKNDLSEKYSAICESFDVLSAEAEGLRQFKENAEHVAMLAKIDSVLSQFADLEGNEAFENVKEHAEEYDIDTLEEKCFAIRGRNNTSMRFSYEQKSPKIIITQGNSIGLEDKTAPYGGIVEYYESKHN